MKKERLFQILLTLMFCILFSGTTPAQQPNILWIMTDDQRMDSNSIYNLSTTGTEDSPLGHVSSPNVDALAAEGVFFPNTYCNSPACAPSRGSMITGKYPHHAGIYGFEQTHDQPDFVNQNLPQMMKELGYQASLLGKGGYRIYQWGPGVTWSSLNFYDYEMDYKNDLRALGFTDWYSRAYWEGGENIGTRTEFYFPDGRELFYFTDRKGGLTTEDLENKAQAEEELDLLYSYTRSNPDLIIGGQSPMPKDKTVDGRILEEFKNYLSHQGQQYQTLADKTMFGANPSSPQFINLSFHFPHTPVLPPKEFRDQFKDQNYEVPDFDQSEVDKLPPQMKALYEKLKIDGLRPEEKQQAIRDYYAFCAYGDYLVGEAVNAFKNYSKKNGQEYLILYVSGDHGWHLGEQGIEAKFTPWRLSTQGMAIVASSRADKYPVGTVYDGLAEYVDFVPTMLAAAGADLTQPNYQHLDGYDWAELLSEEKEEKEYIIGEMNHVVGPRAYLRNKNFAFSMRTRPSNAKPGGNVVPNQDIQWALEAEASEVDLALYDLRIDPDEQNNLANQEAYAALSDWFRTKLGRIVLGDGRIECDWSQINTYDRSDFALGSDDKKLDIPDDIIPDITQIDIVPTRIQMTVEDQKVLDYTIEGSSGSVSWSSSDPQVATVDQNGQVTLLSKGYAGITATLPDGQSDICVVYTQPEIRKDEEENVTLDIKKKDELSYVYPNPFHEQLDISSLPSEYEHIEVWNLSGQHIEDISIQEYPSKTIGQKWPKGTYILKITTKSEPLSIKVIKQ
ncbi:sulfatase-like hydrolase/transferase [Reichenbachiella agariperforans]|uniref:sulfatase-like hydrolase/transferase n=1 Tax=Reichenbachiella agariperforans TaxID=156994 RepID=UPI001C07F238|nr:sulfatase-like hydrolase/transferase [Reichenbachiella agariperforans]MBU2912614.1 sulfatase-like hydrolase/transferase [Reichenbachiella agariperforans]